MKGRNCWLKGCLILVIMGSLNNGLAARQPAGNKIIAIGSRLELFVDDALIEKMDGVHLQLQTPQMQPLSDSPFPTGIHSPIERAPYATVIKDGDVYRAYYHDIIPNYKGPWPVKNPGQIACYAESPDGVNWGKPNLGLYEFNGSRANNVILHDPNGNFCHNFTPFLDERPEKDRGKRFKAVAGLWPEGIYAFHSDDGIHWAKMQDSPIIKPTDAGLDSQNVAFWSEVEGRYVCYFRTWNPPGKVGPGQRTISRMVSPDFLHWSDRVETQSNLPGEHLYTNGTHPYFRAPHIYIALARRLQPNNETDILLMTARDGATTYTRQFKEAFIRPGLDPERWGFKRNSVALNVVPTGPGEMTIYHAISGHRYTLRTDGFVSAHAGFMQGELLTKPLSFSGKELILNYSTSARGSLRIEIQDANGAPIPGFGLEDSQAIFGDEIERRVEWKQKPDLVALQGKPVRLRFVMKESDLYSFRFQPAAGLPP